MPRTAALLYRIQVLLAVLDADAGATLPRAVDEPARVAAADLGALPSERVGAENPLAELQCTPRARRETQGVLVFVNTARTAQRVAHALTQCGLRTGAIHKRVRPPLQPPLLPSALSSRCAFYARTTGRGAQVSGQRRVDELNAFREGETQVLVATDVASRGVDLPNASHVVQAEFALDVTSHLHRVGRTARAAAEGKGACRNVYGGCAGLWPTCNPPTPFIPPLLPATHLVGPENAMLVGALEEQTRYGASEVSALFSRKRRLRNKLRGQGREGE